MGLSPYYEREVVLECLHICFFSKKGFLITFNTFNYIIVYKEVKLQITLANYLWRGFTYCLSCRDVGKKLGLKCVFDTCEVGYWF